MNSSFSLRTLLVSALLVTGALATIPATNIHPTLPAPSKVAPAVPLPTIPDVCYTKSTKCCFTFSPCGFAVRRVEVVIKCPFRKCTEVCKPVCRNVRVKEPRQECTRRRVRVSSGKHCGKWNLGLGKVSACNPKFTYKRHCVTKHVWMLKKSCKNVCGKYCKRVPATCTRFRIIKTPKYCPTLACEKEVITGPTAKPAVVLGKPLPSEYTPIVRTPKH